MKTSGPYIGRDVTRIGRCEVYQVGFGTKAWGLRIDGQRGAMLFSTRAEAIEYANKHARKYPQ